MVKVVRLRFQNCFFPLTILLVEWSSEAGLFRHFLTTFFDSIISDMTQLWRTSFFWKCLKFNLEFKRDWEIVFCFSDNGIWIFCLKLSLLRRKGSSSAVHVLTNSLKILHIPKRDFLQLETLELSLFSVEMTQIWFWFLVYSI